MNKHAYLIIAHKNPNQLQKLINTLDDRRNDIYILIDKKSNISIDLTAKYSKIIRVEPISIYWGDYSQIEAEMMLFKKAYLYDDSYVYFHLLSGLDLPLANQEYIHSFFDKHPNKIFITYSGMLDQDVLKLRIQKHRFTHYFRSTNKILNYYRNFEGKYLMKFPKNKFDASKIGFASQWVSVEREFVGNLVKDEKVIKDTFYGGLCVDELFIPTYINLNPEFKKKIYYDKCIHDQPSDFQGNLRYINWWDGSPYVWRIEDYDKLKNARQMGHLFSRKFDEEVDSKIIDRIVDDIIHGKL